MSMGDVMAVCPACGEMYYHVNGHTCKQPKSAYIMPSPDAYALLLADLRALKADFAALQERVADLEERLHEAEMRA